MSSHAHQHQQLTKAQGSGKQKMTRILPQVKLGSRLAGLLESRWTQSQYHPHLSSFSSIFLRALCRYSAIILRQAARNVSMGKRYKWTDVSVPEFFKYIGLVVFIAMLPLSHVQDYWRRNNIFSVPFPATVMTRDRFRVLSWNIHISNPEEDVENDSKKGTPDHDCLFRTRHLLDDIRTACLSCYHPRINLAIDERMVATKARIGIKQYTKNKPTKWGFKLFVLADSSNGYTLDFTVYTGKTKAPSGNGLSYDSVMNLLKPSYLGTGYNIYVNNFYTSPKLFLDLAKMKFGACGTYRDNRKGFPSGRANALNSNSPRGSIRWIREDPLLFVKWMDTREVSLCSTIHPAFSSETVQRRVKGSDGHWTLKDIPCPTPVMAYNKHMGGVDLSDQLIQYYTTHRTSRWYQTLFYNFLDIATTNAYILHCEISEVKQAKPMTHKDFMEALIAGLCGTDRAGVSSSSRGSSHVPVAIALSTDPSKKATQGRRSCERCRTVHKKIQMTPWKCKACDVSLCLIVDRNCFEKWHSKTEKNT